MGGQIKSHNNCLQMQSAPIKYNQNRTGNTPYQKQQCYPSSSYKEYSPESTSKITSNHTNSLDNPPLPTSITTNIFKPTSISHKHKNKYVRKKVHLSASHAPTKHVKHSDKTRQKNSRPKHQSTEPKNYHRNLPSRRTTGIIQNTSTEDGN